MFWNHRPNGISLLLACQNEEAILPLCIKSFREFADEIIIVDNGSTDKSKEIAVEYKHKYPSLVYFHDEPELVDLNYNRQFALERANFRWIVRGDSDYVAYTSGEYDIKNVRNNLLQQPRSILPKFFEAIQPNLFCDFFHTGIDQITNNIHLHNLRKYVSTPITTTNIRIYEYFPGFRFQRVGRWELTSFNKLIRLLRRKLNYPLWMHCSIKSDRAYFLRSERTNWRELGDFNRYPTLMSFILDKIQIKYGTQDIDEAADIYMQTNVYPFLMKYDQVQYFPYPDIVKQQIEHNPIFKVRKRSGVFSREYYC